MALIFQPKMIPCPSGTACIGKRKAVILVLLHPASIMAFISQKKMVKMYKCEFHQIALKKLSSLCVPEKQWQGHYRVIDSYEFRPGNWFWNFVVLYFVSEYFCADPLVGEELYAQLFFSSVNCGRPIYSL